MMTRWLAAAAVVLAALAPTPASTGAPRRVVIDRDRVSPETLEALTGERVDFVNRAGLPVHLQLGDNDREHEVIQIPVTGPIRAVFHRPGTHPYIVHIYGRQTRALAGVVVVTTDATHQWQAGTCDVVVEDNCLEP
jgi:hypothetical protein